MTRRAATSRQMSRCLTATVSPRSSPWPLMCSLEGADAMNRRTFLGAALACAAAPPLFAALRGKRWDAAAEVLEQATAAKQVDAAVLHVVQRDEWCTRH